MISALRTPEIFDCTFNARNVIFEDADASVAWPTQKPANTVCSVAMVDMGRRLRQGAQANATLRALQGQHLVKQFSRQSVNFFDPSPLNETSTLSVIYFGAANTIVCSDETFRVPFWASIRRRVGHMTGIDSNLCALLVFF
jgi:hypothetical protein